MAHAVDSFENLRPLCFFDGKGLQAFMQRFVRFARCRRGEVRAAERARAALEARLEPAPQRVGLPAASAGTQRDHHSAEIIVTRGCEAGPEAEELRGFGRDRIADQPAL